MNIKKDEGEEFWYSNISEADQEALVNAIIDKNDPNWIGDDGQRLVLEDYFFKFAEQQAKVGEQKATGKVQKTGALSAEQAIAEQQAKAEGGYKHGNKGYDHYLNQLDD
jgi:hypothetical protein